MSCSRHRRAGWWDRLHCCRPREKRGPSKHRLYELTPRSAIDVLECWVPAFAGTTTDGTTTSHRSTAANGDIMADIVSTQRLTHEASLKMLQAGVAKANEIGCKVSLA